MRGHLEALIMTHSSRHVLQHYNVVIAAEDVFIIKAWVAQENSKYLTLRGSWSSQILTLKSSPVHLANLQSRAFSISHNDPQIAKTISFLLVMTLQGNNCY